METTGIWPQLGRRDHLGNRTNAQSDVSIIELLLLGGKCSKKAVPGSSLALPNLLKSKDVTILTLRKFLAWLRCPGS